MRCRSASHFDAIHFSLHLFHWLGGKLDHLQVLQLQVGSERVVQKIGSISDSSSAQIPTTHLHLPGSIIYIWPAQSSSLFPRVERMLVWACSQLLGDVSMPSERRRSASVPGLDTKERELHHAPSTEANYLLRVIRQLEPVSTN